MPLIASISALAGLSSLAFASPIDNAVKRAPASFRINQVEAGASRKVGAIALQKAYHKYGKTAPQAVADAAAAASSGTVAAKPEQYDSEYLCPVTVGSTTMHLDFDTGSADLWVFSDLVPSADRGNHPVYKTSAANRLTGQSWSISYGDGSGASGQVYADTVQIGAATATKQAVEAATSVSSQFASDADNDGLVGLAFSSINTVTPTRANTFFDTVKSSLASAVFAADLKKGAAGSYDFGYIDTSKYQGDLVYTKIDTSQGFWMFTADEYSVGSTAGSGAITGIADTGTTLLLLDDSVVSTYYAQVSGSSNDATQGGYIFPCGASLPTFSITVGGEVRTIPGSYMNYAPTDNTSVSCFGGIQSNSGVGFSIFGDIFLKSQYVVFDQTQGSPRIGFGQQ